MMQLWGTKLSKRGAPDDDDNDIELTDLESGFDSNSSNDILSPMNVFGRPLAEERRRMERAMILKHDTRELRRGDAWFIIESSWMDAWMLYVLSDEDPDCPVVKPGPLTNYSLFDPKEYCLKKGLVATTHYRGVNPMVYALYAELYGTAGAKPIARWSLDIYAVPVMMDDVRTMLHGPELKARVEVSELNDRFDVEERPDRSEEESRWYRCLCRCEYLLPCLGRLLGGPTYTKDNPTKKRKKRKKRKEDYDSDSDSSGDESSETRGLLG